MCPEGVGCTRALADGGLARRRPHGRADPPNVASAEDFQHWLCGAHNTVNRRCARPPRAAARTRCATTEDADREPSVRDRGARRRSLGKPTFNCQNVGARWQALDCDSVCVLGRR